jgi:hypothetical protein
VVRQRERAVAVLARQTVQLAAAQARAERAQRAALERALGRPRQAVGGLVIRHAERIHVSGQRTRVVPRHLRVDVGRADLEAHRRAGLQVQQHVQQRQAVLAARHADQDAVTVADQVEIANRLGGGGD